jgi:protein phosphatase PTC1
VPDALDRAFVAVDQGLEKEEIMYPGATCVAAFVHVDEGKVRARVFVYGVHQRTRTDQGTTHACPGVVVHGQRRRRPRRDQVRCAPLCVHRRATDRRRCGRSRTGKAVRLTYDHKALDMNERVRVIESGGFFMRDRVNGALAVTRALGDVALKPYVSGHPFTTETALRPDDDIVILACDGVRPAMRQRRLRPQAHPVPTGAHTDLGRAGGPGGGGPCAAH